METHVNGPNIKVVKTFDSVIFTKKLFLVMCDTLLNYRDFYEVLIHY